MTFLERVKARRAAERRQEHLHEIRAHRAEEELARQREEERRQQALQETREFEAAEENRQTRLQALRAQALIGRRKEQRARQRRAQAHDNLLQQLLESVRVQNRDEARAEQKQAETRQQQQEQDRAAQHQQATQESRLEEKRGQQRQGRIADERNTQRQQEQRQQQQEQDRAAQHQQSTQESRLEEKRGQQRQGRIAEQQTTERQQTRPAGRARHARVSQRRAGPRRPDPNRCNEPVHHATNFRDFVRLLRAAEARLIQCGHRDVTQRLHILSGIYYATEWSRDFQVERSMARNVGFQAFLLQLYQASDDPRPCLGCGLFLSVRSSQDVGGVDMGHVVIGMNARTGFLSRSTEVPFHRATGLELTTWVGDLGGAAARLALDRLARPNASSARYFRGTDYGAPSNLEGDIAAFVIAANGSSGPTAPVIPAGETIASAFEAYFIRRVGFPDRCRRFLEMQGGKFTDGSLTNRNAVEQAMARKLEGFGRIYAANFLRSRGRFDPQQLLAVFQILGPAAAEVAARFVDWLVACRPSVR